MTGILLKMNITSMLRYRMYWAADQNLPQFDRFYKVRLLLEHIQSVCLKTEPSEWQSTDEQIIPY
ncbi:hypothetical protein T4E_4807 [Trichinella pseudospiralis]|uniref:PiggyBac transposable element-derived protein domain-containing protein n=1 Tax=Trichinella pseudospiralis TaxID=6337 RepID=A0A0V0Y4J7_TRIPS|nr:hypothetical protein T4E_4807 [Trichinella pseudospiralis]